MDLKKEMVSLGYRQLSWRNRGSTNLKSLLTFIHNQEQEVMSQNILVLSCLFRFILPRAQPVKWCHLHSGWIFQLNTQFKKLTGMFTGQHNRDNSSLRFPSQMSQVHNQNQPSHASTHKKLIIRYNKTSVKTLVFP